MKELSIKEKAERYDEAIEIARKLNNGEGVPAPPDWTAYEVMFPELKESEDLEIKSDIQYAVRCAYGDNSSKTERILAWLDKQGEKDNISIDFVLGYLGIKPAYKDGNAWCILLGDNIQEGICGFGDTKEEALIAFIKELIEEQGKKKPNPYSGTSFECNGHTWGMCARDGGVEILIDGHLKARVFINDSNAKEMFIKALERVEEQNSKGYKLTDCDKNSWWEDFKTYTSCAIGQKSIDDLTSQEAMDIAVAKCFKQGEKPQGKSALEAAKEEKVDNWNCVKPADKVEPKFHKNEWIIFNGLILYVDEVVQGYYRTISIDGIPNSYDWDIDNAARLWTIQEAKAGDMLVDIYGSIGIFEERYRINWHTYCYLGNEGRFISEGGSHGSTCYPATKEQRDTLMKAMADAGYTFDFEKKELKKIEHKPVWSEDDKKMIDAAIQFAHEYGRHGLWCWLKSLKDRFI